MLDELLDLAEAALDISDVRVLSDVLALTRDVADAVGLTTEQRARLKNLDGVHAFLSGRTDAAESHLAEACELAEETDGLRLQASVLQNLGILAGERGELSAARGLYGDALRQRLEAEDAEGAVRLLVNIGSLAVDEQDLEFAHETLDLAHEIAEEIRRPELLTGVHGARGRLLASSGRFVDAEVEFRESLRRARRYERHGYEVAATLNLARVKLDRGQVGQAIRWARKARRLAREVPILVEAVTLLARALGRRGRMGEARAVVEEALEHPDLLPSDRATLHLVGAEIAANEDLPAAERHLDAALAQGDERSSRLLLEAGRVALVCGQGERGMTLLREAVDACEGWQASVETAASAFEVARVVDVGGATEFLDLLVGRAQEHGNAEERYGAAANAGAYAVDVGDRGRALRFFEKAVGAAVEAEDLHREFEARNDLAIQLAEEESYDPAIEHLRRCLELAEDLDDDDLLHQALSNLGEMSRRADRAADAVELHERGLDLAERMGSDDLRIASRNLLGLALVDAGEVDVADRTFRAAYELASAADMVSEVAAAEAGLAQCAFARGDFEEALSGYTRATDLRRDPPDPKAVESAAGQVLAVTAAGHSDEDVSAEAQVLVDLAQRWSEEEVAAETLMSAAYRALLDERVELAAGLSAAAVVCRGTGAASEEAGEVFGGWTAGAVLMGREAAPELADAFIEALTEALTVYLPGLEDLVEETIEQAQRIPDPRMGGQPEDV